MSVGMASWAPGPMIMEELRMKAPMGPRGGQLLHRGIREEVEDPVGKGLSIRGRQEEPSLGAEDPARLLEEPPWIVEVFEDLRRYDRIEGTVSEREGFGVRLEHAHPGRGRGHSRRPPRVNGLDPRRQDVHRDDVDPGALGDADRQGARAAAHVEDPRGRSSAGREDPGGYEPLSGEVFPGHVARRPDQLVEDPLNRVSMGQGWVHGRCEAGRAPYTCRRRGPGPRPGANLLSSGDLASVPP